MRNSLTQLVIGAGLLLAVNSTAKQTSNCLPYAVLLGQYKNGISVEKLLSARGVGIAYGDCKKPPNDYHVKRCSLHVFRQTEILFSRTVFGENAGFDKETLDLFRQLKSGDTVIFDDIRVDGPDKKERVMSPIKLYIDGKKSSISTHNKNAPHSLITRIIAITDSVFDTKNKKMVTYQDTVLARLLVEKAKSGKIKAYAPPDFDSNKVLSVTDVNKIFAPISDTVEVEDVDGSVVKKIQSGYFVYAYIHRFKVLEEWTTNKKTGESDLKIIAVAPVCDWYDDNGIGHYKNLFWLDYNDVRDDLMKYESPHLDHPFSQAVWADHRRGLK